jgi:hypothetical protein
MRSPFPFPVTVAVRVVLNAESDRGLSNLPRVEQIRFLLERLNVLNAAIQKVAELERKAEREIASV